MFSMISTLGLVIGFCYFFGSEGRSEEHMYTLNNSVLAVSVSEDGNVAKLTQRTSTPPQVVEAPLDGDGWSVTLSDYNVSTGVTVLAPSKCAAPQVNTSNLPLKLTFNYKCSAWVVEIDYSTCMSCNFVNKGLRVASASSAPWNATIRSIQLFRGQSLQDYDGFVALEPTSAQFHPKNGQQRTFPGFGVHAEFVAAFFRRRAANVGLFVSVQNPFGNYSHQNAIHRTSHFPSNTTWDTRKGNACNNAKDSMVGSHFKNVSGDNGCIALCASNPICMQWQYKPDDKSCQLYNGTHMPQPNEIFDCGCRGSCPQSPGPAPSPPSHTWVTYPGYACNEGSTQPINQTTCLTMDVCKSVCQANPHCVEWMFQNSSHTCWLYGLKSKPGLNADFDCGCRDECIPSPVPPMPSPNTTIPSVIWASFDPLFLQTTLHPIWFVSEPVTLGTTTLHRFNVDSSTKINQGEAKAFTDAVEATLMDVGTDGLRHPVRVQVGWDSNDYQIDVGTSAGQTEYQRMLVRDSSLGITHAIFAPFNSLESSRKRAVDAWGWEETLWLGLGQRIRRREWLPQRDEVPQEIRSIIDFGFENNVKLLAYMYPVLPFEGDGAERINGDGWLYDGTRDVTGRYNPGRGKAGIPNCTEPDTITRAPCADTRASLASVLFQRFLAETMIAFVNKTRCGGFAFDYTSFNDWRQPTDYAEWRGWHWVLSQVRTAIPDIVMDHRQQSHNWGPWSHREGSYTEPIAGDENPESYGAAGVGGIPTLSTDGVLANNMRRVNYVYRNIQLTPNARIPGFMSHQSERSFPDGNGPAQKNYSAVNVRDFDIRGYKYGLLSSIGTAGLNNVVAMLPARDISEFNSFPSSEIAWIQKWLNFTDANAALFARTISIPSLDRGADKGGGQPAYGAIDGTASLSPDGSKGFIFFYNPGPRTLQASFTLDEDIGISNDTAAGTYAIRELYPREYNNTVVAISALGGSVTVNVAGCSAQVLWLQKHAASDFEVGGGLLQPIVLNMSYSNASVEQIGSGENNKTDLHIHVVGAMGLTGCVYEFETIVSVPSTTTYRFASVLVNGVHAVTVPGTQCKSQLPHSALCVVSRVQFNGSALLRVSSEATLSSPNILNTSSSTWFNTTLQLDPSVLHQLMEQQLNYPVAWNDADKDAPWLGNRLLLYIYITQPDPNKTRPRVWIDSVEHPVQLAYNSRGNTGGGAGSGGGSGRSEQCYLGAYIDATDFKSGRYNMSILIPSLSETESEFVGVFWYGTQEKYTDSVVGALPAGNLSQCRVAQPLTTAPPAAKSVLYIIVDDLRPQLGAYNSSVSISPNIDAFAAEATVFENAYAQIAVCSPSRNSFLSGQRPDTIETYNFVNHIRQARCPSVVGSSTWLGSGYRNISIDKTEGAAGECCTQCTDDSVCTHWAYHGSTVATAIQIDVSASAVPHSYCTLYSEANAVRNIAALGTVSGLKGARPTITTIPQHFKDSGFLAFQSGKIFHTEEGNLLGNGMPPLQDYPLSWTSGCSMSDVNEVAPMNTCDKVPGTQGCPINASMDGNILDVDQPPLCDKVIADDALAKLHIAVQRQTPFFLAVGFRKPHMPWRFPAPILSLYPNASSVAVAAYPELDLSVPPISHHSPDLGSQGGGDPYHSLNKTIAQHDRLFYYASTTWMDSQIGRLLKELNALGQEENTLVVMHADHGWALGEHGQWQKFNNWEVGTRVPFMIRAPWLRKKGIRSSALVELIDVFPTICDLAHVPYPKLSLDGLSVGWVIRNETVRDKKLTKAAVLSQYPRCPLNSTSGEWISNLSDMWMNNWCEFVDKAEIPFMGYSMRTAQWRYTEWVRWNGTSLRPIWSDSAGVELYDHSDAVGSCFDCNENINLASNPNFTSVVHDLSQLLHEMVGAK